MFVATMLYHVTSKLDHKTGVSIESILLSFRKFEISDGKKYMKFEYLKLEDLAGKFSPPKKLSFTRNLSEN